MTLTINVPEEAAKRWNSLTEDERNERAADFADSLITIPPSELTFVTETSPEVRAQLAAEAAEQSRAFAALLKQLAEGKDDEIELEMLQANMNANRAATGERPIF